MELHSPTGERLPARTARAAGFTYISVLVIVAFMGVALALVGEAWNTAATRDREAELLFVGNQFRRAIGLYYVNSPGVPQYPRQLSDLIKDSRTPAVRRYLRKLYPDPITGSAEWGVVKSPDGGIMGVFSQSEALPLKGANFRVRDRGFESKSKYSEWQFIFVQQGASPARPIQQGGSPAGTLQQGGPPARTR